jgi:hypothetical protein
LKVNRKKKAEGGARKQGEEIGGWRELEN